MNVANQIEAALRLHTFAVALSDLAYFARVPEPDPRPDGWAGAMRDRIHTAGRHTACATRRLSNGDWPAGVTAESLNRLTRTARSDALELVVMLSDDGRWGVPYYSWPGEADRRVVDRVDAAAVQLRELVGQFDDLSREGDTGEESPTVTESAARTVATPQAIESPPPPPPLPDGPFDEVRKGLRVFGMRVGDREIEFTSEEAHPFAMIRVLWSHFPDGRPTVEEVKQAMRSGAANERWAENLARKTIVPLGRCGFTHHLKADKEYVWWVHFGPSPGNVAGQN